MSWILDSINSSGLRIFKNNTVPVKRNPGDKAWMREVAAREQNKLGKKKWTLEGDLINGDILRDELTDSDLVGKSKKSLVRHINFMPLSARRGIYSQRV